VEVEVYIGVIMVVDQELLSGLVSRPGCCLPFGTMSNRRTLKNFLWWQIYGETLESLIGGSWGHLIVLLDVELQRDFKEKEYELFIFKSEKNGGVGDGGGGRRSGRLPRYGPFSN
jgi:hypothetical protein